MLAWLQLIALIGVPLLAWWLMRLPPPVDPVRRRPEDAVRDLYPEHRHAEKGE